MNIALDLDGTLISCEPRQSAVLRAALIHCGATSDAEQTWKLKREGASTEQALVQLGMETPLARCVAADWLRMIEEPFWLGLDSVLPGAFDSLRRLSSAGSTLWLLTARSRREWVPLQLAQLGLSHWLDRVAVVPARAAAAAKATILRDTAVTAFFGDTESDHRASLEAGVPFYAVASGQRSAAFLRGAGVPHPFDNIADAATAFIGKN